MFPLSEEFLGIIPSAAYFAYCAFFTLLAFRRFGFALVPVLTMVVLFLAWFWNRDTTLDPYGILFALITLPILTGFAAGWGGMVALFQPLLGHGGSKRPNIALQCAISLVPTIIIVGWKFERQNVLPSPCSEERLAINIGTATFNIHPEMRTFLKRGKQTSDAATQSHIRYSLELDRKEELRKLCDAAEGGQKAVSMHGITFSPSDRYDRMSEVCGGALASTRPYCNAGLPAVLADIRRVEFVDSTVNDVPTNLSWMEKDDSGYLRTGGNDRNGFICLGDDDADSHIRCYAWLEIKPDTTLFVDTMNFSTGTKSEHLDRAQMVLDWVPKAFMQ